MRHRNSSTSTQRKSRSNCRPRYKRGVPKVKKNSGLDTTIRSWSRKRCRRAILRPARRSSSVLLVRATRAKMVARHARYRRDRSTRWRRCFLRCVDSPCSVCVSSYASASRPRYDPPPSALQPPPLVQGLVFCPSVGIAALVFVASLSISSRVRFRFQLFVREDRQEKTETRSPSKRDQRPDALHLCTRERKYLYVVVSYAAPSRPPVIVPRPSHIHTRPALPIASHIPHASVVPQCSAFASFVPRAQARRFLVRHPPTRSSPFNSRCIPFPPLPESRR